MNTYLNDLIYKAKHGDVEAMLSVAKYYMEQENYINAHEYFLMAAQKGDAFAEHKVGVGFCFGTGGIEQNLPLGVKYLQRAADKDNAHAEFTLAMVCDRVKEAKAYLKEGTPENAYLYYLEKAGKHGHAYAQVLLGDMYIEGKAVEYDLEQAIFWWGCASLHEEENAANERNEANDKLHLLLKVVPKSEVDVILNEIKTNYPTYLYHNY